MTDTITSSPQADASEQAPIRFLELASAPADASKPSGLAHQRILLCAAGQTVARVTSSVEPLAPGARAFPLASIQLGKNVAWNDDRSAILATRPGHILLDGCTLLVEETLELAVDIDAAMPIDFPGDISALKNILDQSKVAAQGNITVNGAVEAADVILTGNLIVHRGICGKERGKISAGGSVQARFASNASIRAGSDVQIQNEIANSHIRSAGKIIADNASILSSRITATCGISCHAAGSTAGFRTVLELGLDPAEFEHARKTFADVAAQKTKAQEIRSKVEPLLKNQKNLTAQQKEKATELLYLADEADVRADQTAAALAPLRARMESALAGEIRIGGTLHEGVLLRCLGYEVITTTALRGPLRITLKLKTDGALFVIADSHNTPMTTLQAVATDACSVTKQLQHLKSQE